MRQKNAIFKFNKKPLKSFKISDAQYKINFDDFYSKIFLNYFEPHKQKEESKNNIDNNTKLKNNKKAQLSSNNSNRILRISFNEYNKFNKKNNIDLNNNNEAVTKGRKTENINKKILAKKIIQSISEKNINRDKKDISKSNTNIKLKHIQKKKSDFSNNNTIKLNLHNNISNNKLSQKPQNGMNNIALNNINNINKERKNKSLEKRKERKIKNFVDKKSINLRININEAANNKKSNYQFIHKKNKANLNKSLNKRNLKSNNKSPEIKTLNNNIKEKNLNKSKKIINTDVNPSSKLFIKKKIKKNTDSNSSSKNIFDKKAKISSLKMNLMDKKMTKNIILNSSNSKANNGTKHQTNFKKIKVESIKIDLNSINPQKNYSFISQEKTTADNNFLNDKNNFTVRGTEIKKFNKKNTELNLVGQEMSELNRSFKTSFSINKARSLSKKRDEKKMSKINNLGNYNNSEENNRKLNNILICLSNIRIKSEKEFEKKSEPKKLIDKIRKFKKLQKM